MSSLNEWMRSEARETAMQLARINSDEVLRKAAGGFGCPQKFYKMRRALALQKCAGGGGIAIAAAAFVSTVGRLPRGAIFKYGIENWGTGRIGLFLPNLREPRCNWS